jgi:hypothetical protein
MYFTFTANRPKKKFNLKSKINKKKVNGNFQISAVQNDTNKKVFEFPLKIKNNKAYMLFVPVFDLDKLFSFFLISQNQVDLLLDLLK